MNENYSTQDDFNLNDFVPKYFEMDPELHDLLPNGKRLKNGMWVLIGDDNERVQLTALGTGGVATNSALLKKARKWNRWVTVTDLEIVDKLVTFVGLFEDGTKQQFVKNTVAAWYVQLDSIPEEDPLAKEAAELKESLASLVETSKVAWSGLLDALKSGLTEEADRLDEAAEKLYANSKNVKFSGKPEDIGTKKYTINPKTAEAMMWAFIGENADFLISKEVHSLNQLHHMYTRYCDKVIGLQWKLKRRDFMEHLKVYFGTWADVKERDGEGENGEYVADTELIGFNPKPVDVEAGYSEKTNDGSR